MPVSHLKYVLIISTSGTELMLKYPGLEGAKQI